MATSVRQPGKTIFGLASERPSDARKGTAFYAIDTGVTTVSLGGGAWAEGSVNELKLGAPDSATVAGGVLTVTGLGSYINIIGEGATTDTIDSVVKVGAAPGDILLIRNLDADVMTFDNSATLLLGAATRALAVGGSIMLVCTNTNTVWAEIAFTATTT